MKKVLFLCLSVILSMACISQESDLNTELSDKRWQHGFNVLVSQSNLIYDSNMVSPIPRDQPQLSNSLGFGLGLTTEYKATKHLSARASAGLAFNGGHFSYTVVENGEPAYEKDQHFLPITLDGGFHGIVTLKEEGISPYAILGATARIPIDSTDDSTEFTASNGFISADLGIGLNAPVTHFNICPELRYSYALQGMNHALIPEKTYMHQVSLIIGFKG